jgi:menaquinone-9 beta-reductase
VRTLQELGLSGVFDGFQPIEQIRVRSPNGYELAGDLPSIDGGKPIGYVVPRVTFDNFLAQAALKRGATDLTGHALLQAMYDAQAGHWEIKVRRGTGSNAVETTLTSKVLVGADGARSVVRRILGIPYNAPHDSGIAIRMYADVVGSMKRVLELDFMRELLPAYGWLFPISEGRANVGVGIDSDLYKKRGHSLESLLREYQGLLGKLYPLRFEKGTESTYILPYGSKLPPLVKGRALLIGDAASMINPMTGEGIYYGVYAGQLAGRLLAPALRNGGSVDSALAVYESTFRRKFKRHFKANFAMKRMATKAFWSNWVIKAASRDASILADSVQVMMGDGDRLSPLNALKIVVKGF